MNCNDLPENEASTSAEVNSPTSAELPRRLVTCGFDRVHPAGLLQQLKAAQGQITALQSAYASASKPSDRERELQAQLEFASKARGQHPPMRERIGASSGGLSAKQRCEQLRDELVAGGMDRQSAWCKVMDQHPDLRQQMVDEANGR